MDGLKGFPEAIETIYPKTQVQLCLVHLMRFSLAYVSFKDRKAVTADLKAIYRAAASEEAEQRLEAFTEKWNGRYPSIAKSWRANWARAHPMFGFPDDIRRVVYTTNAIESLNMSGAESHQGQSLIPFGRGGVQAALFSLAQRGEKADDAD